MTTYYDAPMTESEYMRVEEADPERHEYVAGRMFAMSGASRVHNRIVMNLGHYLFDPVDARGCLVVSNSMKVKVEALGAIYYPDVVVACDDTPGDTHVLTAPCLIIEVLSPSTMSIDRREKLMAYRAIPSVKEYLLVYQDRKQVELYRKNASGEWEFEVYKGSDRISLTAVANEVIELSLDDIYHRLDPS